MRRDCIVTKRAVSELAPVREPNLMSDDLSEISLGDLFQPTSYNPSVSDLNSYPLSIDPPPSVGLGLKDEMENYQDLCPSLVLSPAQWRPPDESPNPVKTLMMQEEDSIAKQESYDPLTSSLWLFNLDGISQAENRRGFLTDPDSSWTQSGITVPVHMDDEGAKVNYSSNEAKVKLKQKVMASKTQKKNAGVTKVGSRGGGGGRRVTTWSASSSCSSKEEERKRRRQESNRRAAERYRTKLKASAIDVATEHHRLMKENERLNQEKEVYRRQLSLIIASIMHHKQFCSAPFHLTEQSDLKELHTVDASTTQVGSNSAETFQAQFQIGSSPGTAIAAELSIQNCCALKQNGSGPVDTSCQDNHGRNETSSIPFLVAEPFQQHPFQKPQLNCFGQLRVIGLYAKSPI